MEEILRTFNPWWAGKGIPESVPRPRYIESLHKELRERDVVLITGIRRVGKTVILQQMIGELLEEHPPQNIMYVSMDHPIFLERSILDLHREHRSLHGISRDVRTFMFLDEVQHRAEFERELKVLYDMENVKVFASGSSSLLLKEKGAFLTGRSATVRVWPLDLGEFLAFAGIDLAGVEPYLLESQLERYLRLGGMPEYVSRGRGPEYLISLVEAVIGKDIVGRHGVRHPDVLRKLILLLAERVGKPMTYNKLARVLGVSTDTVKQHIAYFEETYLVDLVSRDARSLNERIYSPRKVYMADVGIRNALTGFRDIGSLAESLVFNRLKARGEVRYFHEGNREIDFTMGRTAVEVKYKDRLDEQDVRVLQKCRFKEKLLITKRKVEVEGVKAVPLVDFLLER